MNSAGCIRVVLSTLAVVSIAGATTAMRAHQPYLASRLVVLFGAAIYGNVAADRIVAMARAQPRFTAGVGLFLGLVLILAMTLVLVPDRVFRFLAWAVGNPRVRTPFQ